MEKTHELVIVKDNGDELIMEQGNKDFVWHMFNFYNCHKSFFNGKIVFREVK